MEILPLFIHSLVATAVIGIALLFAWLLRERQPLGLVRGPYEGGIAVASEPHRPLTVPYFLIAAFFVIFDMEAAILFGYAIAAQDVGWLGFAEAAIFIFVLLAALFYLWADGALNWGPEKRNTNPERP